MEQVQQRFETDVNEGLKSSCWTPERKGWKKVSLLDYKSVCKDFLKQRHSTLQQDLLLGL